MKRCKGKKKREKEQRKKIEKESALQFLVILEY